MDRKIFVLAPGSLLATGLGLALLSLAVVRIHLRVQTTLIGYEIGHLKNSESRLLETRSTLKMQLAKMTTQKHLLQITTAASPAGAGEGNYAFK